MPRESGRHVQQQHVLHLTAQHATLNGGAHRDGLVGVHVLAGGLAEELLHRLLHHGHAGLAAHQDHLVDLRGGETGVVEGGAAGVHGALHQLLHQGLQFRPGQAEVEVLGSALVGGDVGEVDVGHLAGGELDLGLLRRLLQPLQGQRVVVQVHPLLLLELRRQEIDDAHIEVLAAEEGVAVGGEHLELVLAVHLGDLDDGDIEGAAAQVIDRDLLVAALLVHAVGQGRGGGLVDDALHLQAGDAAGVLGGLALGVVEVGRYGDHRLGDGLAQVVLGGLLHLLQDLGGDLRRRHLLAVDLHPGVAVVGLGDLVGDHLHVALHHVVGVAAADQPLDGEQGVLRIGHRLALGGLADDDLAVLGVGDDGGGGAVALAVLDDADVVALHDRHAGIGGAQVDADDLAHSRFSPLFGSVPPGGGCQAEGRLFVAVSPQMGN
jgi:hypothetical protein